MRPHLRRSMMTVDQQISFKPLMVNMTGPRCLTCLKPVDSELLVEEHRGSHNYARVLVKCHGSEELREFPFLSEDWNYEHDLKRAMQRCAWFDPRGHQQVAGVPNGGVINDPGDENGRL